MKVDDSSIAEIATLFRRSSSGDADAQREVVERLSCTIRQFVREHREFAHDPEHQLQAREFAGRYYERLVKCDPSSVANRGEFFSAYAAAIRRAILLDVAERAETQQEREAH